MIRDEPQVQTDGRHARVTGTFHRAVTPGFEGRALTGSHGAGRYSRADQPTLYLSASRAGVAAAMIAHQGLNRQQTILPFDVNAMDLFDLRSADAIEHVLKNAGDPFSDWQAVAASGGEPPSWRVRDWIERTGAQGMIDPSRKSPGLWHLVLFRWNVPGAPSVRQQALPIPD